MKNKKGWIRIAEAVIAILLLGSVLLVVYSRHQVKKSSSDYFYEMQKKVLEEIATNHRQEVLDGNTAVLESVARASFPTNFEIRVKICDAGAISCDLEEKPLNKEVFVGERIVSATLESFSPKKIKLFVWEG